MLGTWLLLVGGFNPSEKYESQMGLLFPIYGKITMFQATSQIALVSLEEQVSYENFIHIYASNDCGVECWDVSMVEYTWTWWKKCKIIVETPKVKKQHILWMIYGKKRQLQNDKVMFLAFQLQMFPAIINYKTMVSNQDITYRHYTLKVRWLLPPATALIPCNYTTGNWWIIWMFWNTAGGRNLAPVGRWAKSRYNTILYTFSWLLVVSNWCRVSSIHTIFHRIFHCLHCLHSSQ